MQSGHLGKWVGSRPTWNGSSHELLFVALFWRCRAAHCCQSRTLTSPIGRPILLWLAPLAPSTLKQDGSGRVRVPGVELCVMAGASRGGGKEGPGHIEFMVLQPR